MTLLGYVIAGIVTIIAAWIATKMAWNIRKNRKAQATIRSWLGELQAKISEIRTLHPRVKDALESLRPEVSEYRWAQIEHEILGRTTPNYWEMRIEGYKTRIRDHELYKVQSDIEDAIFHANSVLANLRGSADLPERFKQARADAPKIFGETAARITALREMASHADISPAVKRQFDEAKQRYIQKESLLHSSPLDVDWLELAANLESLNQILDTVERRAQTDIQETAEARRKIVEHLDMIPELLEEGEEVIKASAHQSPRAESFLTDAKHKFAEAKAKKGESRESVLETCELLEQTLNLIQQASESDKRHREFISATQS